MNEPVVAPEASDEVKMSRRRLLKAIAATGGAVAASTLLPGKWTKPVVEVGVLPLHAQVSPLLTISDFQVQSLGGILYGANFDYDDEDGEVGYSARLHFEAIPLPGARDDTATLHARATAEGTLIFGDPSFNWDRLDDIGANWAVPSVPNITIFNWETLEKIGAKLSGTSFHGTVRMNFTGDYNITTQFCAQLRVDSRTSPGVCTTSWGSSAAPVG